MTHIPTTIPRRLPPVSDGTVNRLMATSVGFANRFQCGFTVSDLVQCRLTVPNPEQWNCAVSYSKQTNSTVLSWVPNTNNVSGRCEQLPRFRPVRTGSRYHQFSFALPTEKYDTSHRERNPAWQSRMSDERHAVRHQNMQQSDQLINPFQERNLSRL